MSEPLARRPLQELIEAVLNVDASDEQYAQLEAQLLASVEARDAYLDYVNLHAALRQRLLTPEPMNANDFVDFHAEVARDSFPYPRRPRWRVWLTLAASLLLLLTAVAYMQPWALQLRPVATLEVIEGELTIASATGSRVAQVGDMLAAGQTLRLEGEFSRARMAYPDGTQVAMHSGSVVRAPASGHVWLELLAGSLEVEAAKQHPDHPLIITTQHSRYVVLGTRFRLYHDQQASRLELDEGQVRMERPASGEVINIEAGSVAIATDEDTAVAVSPLSPGKAELAHTLSKAGQNVAFSGDHLLTSHASQGLRTWRRDDFSLDQTYGQHVGSSDAIALTADGYLVQVNRNGYVLAWKPGERQALRLTLSGQHTRSRALSPDGLVVAESADRMTKVYRIDLAKQKLDSLLNLDPIGKAWCLALSQDGQYLAAGYWDGTVHVYSVATGEIVLNRKLTHTPTHCALTSDGRSLAVVTQKEGLLLIDIATGEQKLLWPPGANIVRCVRFSKDGQRLLAGFNDRTARMWNAANGLQVLVVDVGHSPQGIAWSEEDQLLATADGSVKVWKCMLPAPDVKVEIR